MTNKILLAKCESSGNLTEHKQMYYIYYLPKVLKEDGSVQYCEKGSVEFVSVSSQGEAVVKSYRMVDPSQERLMILDLIKLFLFHKRDKGELNEFTLMAFANDLFKQAKKIGQEVQEGVYDNGVKI